MLDQWAYDVHFILIQHVSNELRKQKYNFDVNFLCLRTAAWSASILGLWPMAACLYSDSFIFTDSD